MTCPGKKLVNTATLVTCPGKKLVKTATLVTCLGNYTLARCYPVGVTWPEVATRRASWLHGTRPVGGAPATVASSGLQLGATSL